MKSCTVIAPVSCEKIVNSKSHSYWLIFFALTESAFTDHKDLLNIRRTFFFPSGSAEINIHLCPVLVLFWQMFNIEGGQFVN